MLRERFYGSVRIISIERDKLLARLREIAEKIRAEYPEEAEVRVFGSIARGDQTGTSDVDVLIVLRGGQCGQPLEQIRAFYRYFDLPVGVDLLVYTEDQVADRLQRGDAFMTGAWEQSLRLDN